MMEIDDEDKAVYHASIDKKMSWELTFETKKGEALMVHQYQKILPYEKTGTSTYFYPNGNIRKNVINKKGRAIGEKRFHSNGQLHYEIVQNTIDKKQSLIDWYNNEIIRTKEKKNSQEIAGAISRNFTEPDKDDDIEVFYLSVCDTLGNNILDENGNGNETLFDEQRKQNWHLKYVDYQLAEAYYVREDGSKVYHYCEKPLKVNVLKSTYSLKQQVLQTQWDCFPQGTVLVSFVVNSEGLLKDIKLVSSPDKMLASIVLGYLRMNKSALSYRVAKHNGNKVLGEVIVPFYFGIQGYGPTPSANNNMWMMQQQMHMMQMNSFRPPVSF